MLTAQPLTLIGAVPSPYTRKMVALLRYRRLDYRIIWGDPAAILIDRGLERPKVGLLPTCLMTNPGGQVEVVCDSTPIIRRLESENIGRSVIPHDPVVAFLDYLLEDFADEWCTKYMFHYRWYPQVDADNAGTLLPLFQKVDMATNLHEQFKPYIRDRQVGRLHVVGSNDDTAGLIDASYRRFLLAMENHLVVQPFMLGYRPGASDFGIYGQLTQLIGFDPTPRAIAHELAPRVVAWTGLLEDQSGLEPEESDWITGRNIPSSLSELFKEVGRVYAPALLANASALQNGAKTWEAEIDGGLWNQQTFSYQGKCLQWINREYQSLSAADKKVVIEILAGTGCEQILL
jgi:glutathione S-transferase